jgi:hypothetical protein
MSNSFFRKPSTIVAPEIVAIIELPAFIKLDTNRKPPLAEYFLL